MESVKAWQELETHWRRAFELAWEAYAHDTVPVGAVVVDDRGDIIAEGRNHILDPGGDGISGNRLAHSEVNALLKLKVGVRYNHCILYSVLEPCLLCVGAASISTVGSIHYAGRDPYGGASTASVTNARARRFFIQIEGPRQDAFGRLAELLMIEFHLRSSFGFPHVIEALETELPDAVARARSASEHNFSDLAKSSIPLNHALEEIWDLVK